MGYVGALLPLSMLATTMWLAARGYRRYPATLAYLAVGTIAQTVLLMAPYTDGIRPALLLARTFAAVELWRDRKVVALAALGAQALIPGVGSLAHLWWHITHYSDAAGVAVSGGLWGLAVLAMAVMAYGVAALEPASPRANNIYVMPRRTEARSVRRAA